MSPLVLAIGLLIPCVAGAQRPVPPSGCYQYEHDTVTLAGRLIWRIYPGRPNYESVERGDQPDTVFVLRVDHPFCTEASEMWAAQAEVGEVQLILPRIEYDAALRLVNSHFVLTGTLRGADFGWHHLHVLFETQLPIQPRRTEGG